MTIDKILHIAVQSPVPHFFDYLPPEQCTMEQLKPGIRLIVPFRGQKKVGILLSVNDHSTLPQNKILEALDILDEDPMIPLPLLQLQQWASQYYHYPIGEVVVGTLPKVLRLGKNCNTPGQFFFKLSEEGELCPLETLKRTPKQQALLALLKENPAGQSIESLQQAGYSKTLISSLIDKGFLVRFFKEHLTTLDKNQKHFQHPLNSEQQQAVDTVTARLNQFKSFLLQGITGSGKTEVYLHCIDAVLKQNKQALVLVPEIGLTPQTVARFLRHFAVPMAVLHSNCSDNQRAKAWLEARSGKVKIIIGTRSALFVPFLSLGIIIIDESHDLSFKQQDGFRYSARDLGMMRASLESIPIVQGSATPSFESLHNVHNGRTTLLQLNHRTGSATPPVFSVIDIRNQSLREGFSAPLIEKIKQHLIEQNQVLIFLNRRGFAPTLLCHHCGFIASCKHCDARLTLHHQPSYLHCHHCDSKFNLYSCCPECQSKALLPLGLGTERIEKTLATLFKEHEVIRIDRDSTRKKGSLDALLDKITHGKGQLLVGTQMLAKGHHFPNVTLVVILDADSAFFSADFRAEERVAQLILQVGGRAGREEKAGEVVIQTHQPEHPQLIQLLKQGYPGFASTSLSLRKAANLPPYSYMALLRAESSEQSYAITLLQKAKEMMFKLEKTTVNLLGPIPAPMEKLKGQYRAQLLLQSNHRAHLHEILSYLTKQLHGMKIKRNCRWTLDIDPHEMF